MNFKTSAFVLGITAAAAGVSAEEQSMITVTQADPAPAFSDLDADKDGSITLSEAEGSWLADTFTVVDANQDGIIDEAEYAEAMS